MALQEFTDVRGNKMFYDPTNQKVLSEGGTRDTFYKSIDEWNQRQGNVVQKQTDTQLADLNKTIGNIDKKVAERDKAYAEAMNLVNDNPFYSEANRVGRLAKLDEKYQVDRGNLVNEKSTYQTQLQGLTAEQDKVYQRLTQERESNKPSFTTSTDSYGNQILTAYDPYTGRVVSQTNLGGGRSPGSNPANIAISSVSGGTGTTTQQTPSSIYGPQKPAYGPAVPQGFQYQTPKPTNTAQPTATNLPTSPPAPAGNQPNWLQNVGQAFIDPAVNYAKFALEGVAQSQRATQNLLPFSESNRLRNKVVAGTATPQEQQRYIQLNSPAFLSPEQAAKFSDPVSGAIQTAKYAAGGASYAVPGGAGVGGAIRTGVAAGGLSEFSRENATVGSTAMAAGGGALGGAILGSASSLISKGLTRILGGVSSKAAQSLNKATPSQYAKTVEHLGLDPNALTQKYVPAGVGYDDLVGPITEKGRGGILGNLIKTAETAIQNTIKTAGKGKSAVRVTADDFVKVLQQEKKELAKIPGNETNIKALDVFIKETKKLYKGGITAAKLLEVKRAADSKFGAAVVDENMGSVAAQGQKMLANASRAKLKELFPEIAEALQTQSELLTFQPIINRARATANTLGSDIRVGDWAKFNPLNPMSYGKAVDATLANPNIASNALNAGQVQLPGGQGAAANIGRATSAVGEAMSAGQPAGQPPALPESPIGDQQTMMEQAPQGALASQGLTPDILATAIAIDQQETGGEGYQELKRLYDLAVDEEKRSSETSKAPSATEKTKIDLAVSGLRGLDIAQGLLENDSSILAKQAVPGKFFTREYDSAIFRAVEGLLRARSGAAVPEIEVQRYINKFTPVLGDSPAVAQSKLQQLRRDLQDITVPSGSDEIVSPNPATFYGGGP